MTLTWRVKGLRFHPRREAYYLYFFSKKKKINNKIKTVYCDKSKAVFHKKKKNVLRMPARSKGGTNLVHCYTLYNKETS